MKTITLILVTLLAGCGGSDECPKPPELVDNSGLPPFVDPNPPPIYDSPATPCP